MSKVKIKEETLVLANLQKQMQGALLTPFLSPEYQAFITNEVKPSSNMSAKAHLAIYQRSYTARLQQCMATQFPVLQYALGDELFQLFVRQYLHRFPSEHYSLTNLGDNFSLFLQQTRLDADQEIKEDWPDFMIELADFETSLIHLYEQDVVDVQCDSQQLVATAQTKDSQLMLVPVIKFFSHCFPIMAYYKAVNDEQEPELPMTQQSFGVVIRRNYRLAIIELNQSQYLFLTLLLKEQSIEQSKKVMVSAYEYDIEELDTLWLTWRKYFISIGIFNLRIK